MSALALTDEQATWVQARMPCAGRLVDVDDAVRAFELRREHVSYRVLTELFGCSRASVQRAVRLVAAASGNYRPTQWTSIRQGRRQLLVRGFHEHRASLKARRDGIHAEVQALSREPVPAVAVTTPSSPPNALDEQARFRPEAPARRMPGTPARGAINHFARAATPS